MLVLGCLSGCDSHDRLNADQLAEFEAAGPVQLQVDVDRLVGARVQSDVYRVVPGDLLELHMPVSLRGEDALRSASVDEIGVYLGRVDMDGAITLPMVGQLVVAGGDVCEVETSIVEAYYPRYVMERPTVVVRVAEYRTQAVSVVGAVDNPGLYELQHNEMSLVALLMKAGGINGDGAAAIRIRHVGQRDDEARTLVLPVRETNIPFTDVILEQGDVVEVEPRDPDMFTVIGLVKSSGAFPYPPGASYNVMQALAFAGGLNDMADPRYVRVFRQNADGDFIDASFDICGDDVRYASAITVKPGDVVVVEHTLGTRTRLILAEILRISFNVGGDVDVFDD